MVRSALFIRSFFATAVVCALVACGQSETGSEPQGSSTANALNGNRSSKKGHDGGSSSADASTSSNDGGVWTDNDASADSDGGVWTSGNDGGYYDDDAGDDGDDAGYYGDDAGYYGDDDDYGNDAGVGRR